MTTFISTPSNTIIDKDTGEVLYRFNSEGKLRVFNETHIDRMKAAGFKIENNDKNIETALLEPQKDFVSEETTQKATEPMGNYKCKICGTAGFTNLAKLNKHRATHKGAKK